MMPEEPLHELGVINERLRNIALDSGPGSGTARKRTVLHVALYVHACVHVCMRVCACLLAWPGPQEARLPAVV